MERFGVMEDEVPFGTDVETIDLMDKLDDMDANECIVKIENWNRYKDFWLDYYKKKIDEVNAKCDRNIALQNRKLRYFFLTVPHRKTTTMEAYDLPSGRISMSIPKQKMVPNKEAVIARLKKDGDDKFIKIKEELDWNGYKDRLFIGESGEVFDKETGEIVNDISIEMSETKFEVKINKKGGNDNGED